jgi:hypothetical protein
MTIRVRLLLILDVFAVCVCAVYLGTSRDGRADPPAPRYRTTEPAGVPTVSPEPTRPALTPDEVRACIRRAGGDAEALGRCAGR